MPQNFSAHPPEPAHYPDQFMIYSPLVITMLTCLLSANFVLQKLDVCMLLVLSTDYATTATHYKNGRNCCLLASKVKYYYISLPNLFSIRINMFVSRLVSSSQIFQKTFSYFLNTVKLLFSKLIRDRVQRKRRYVFAVRGSPRFPRARKRSWAGSVTSSESTQ